MPPTRREQLAPRDPQLGASPQLLVTAEAVEQVELVRGAREPPLLELAGHRDQPLGDGGDVVPRRRAAPGVGARTAVGEHTARDHEPFLVLGAQLRKTFELLLEHSVGHVELRLDIGLLPVRADESRVSASSEQEADRLSEDGLAGAGLARDRVQPGSELELGLADEDQVLDAQAAQHALDGTHGVGPRLSVLWD